MLLDGSRKDQKNRRMILRMFERRVLGILDNLNEFLESELNDIPSKSLIDFQTYIENIGFELSSEKNGIKELKLAKDTKFLSKAWSLRAHISKKEIWFSAPTTKSYNGRLVTEVFQTASEFTHGRELLIYDTHEFDWLDYNLASIVVRSYDRFSKMTKPGSV